MKTQQAALRYQAYGPTLHDALEAMITERDRVQKCIDQLQRCADMGLLGCEHDAIQPKDDATPTEIGVDHA